MNKIMRTVCVAIMCVLLAATAALALTADEQALFSAIEDDDTVRVKGLLMNGVDPNATDERGATALLYAAGKKKEVIELLLKAGADVNYAAPDGITPIGVAVLWGQLDNVKLLVEKGAQMNGFFKDTETGETFPIISPLAVAAMCPFSRITEMKFLLDHAPSDVKGDYINCLNGKSLKTPLMYAATNTDNLLGLMFLLKLGAKLDLRNGEGTSRKGLIGYTALMLAAANGTATGVEDLLDAGASVTIKDNKGRNVLWYLNRNKNLSDADKNRLRERIFNMM